MGVQRAAAILTLSLLAVLPVTGQSQSNLVAVVHASNDISSLSAGRMRSIFLGSTSYWDGNTRITPYSRPASSSAGRVFLSTVMHMTPSRYRHHWMRLQLSGQGVTPTEVASAGGAVSRVAANPGGISFLTSGEAGRYSRDGRVKLVPVR